VGKPGFPIPLLHTNGIKELFLGGRRPPKPSRERPIRISVMTIGWIECLIILALVALVAAVAFRAGYFRGRGQ